MGNVMNSVLPVVIPSLVAVMIVIPGRRPIVTPEGDTRAANESELNHVTGRSLSGAPAESRGVAVKIWVWPVSIVAERGSSVTVTTRVCGGEPGGGRNGCSHAAASGTARRRRYLGIATVVLPYRCAWPLRRASCRHIGHGELGSTGRSAQKANSSSEQGPVSSPLVQDVKV